MTDVLSANEQAKARAAASEKLQELKEEAADGSEVPSSWIAGADHRIDDDDAPRRSPDCRFFDNAGFLYLPSFVDATTCQAMKDQMAALVETQWNPERDGGIDSFGTDAVQNVARGDYFLASAETVHFFAEPDALDEDGTKLKPEYLQNKLCALNKAGHALHLLPNSIFHAYCLSEELKRTVLDLGWKDPVVPQSMYIFKQAVTGGAVHSHQDSTFLFTTPKQSCLGLWLALDDATLDNGCLWVRPKSHREVTRRQYKRNVEHFGAAAIAARSNVPMGDISKPKFVMEDLTSTNDNNDAVNWDGALPKDLLDAGFIPIECKAGDLLVFCGELDHLSLPNKSDRARHTFQLHLVEGQNEVTWSEYNWLQYPSDKPFLRLLGER